MKLINKILKPNRKKIVPWDSQRVSTFPVKQSMNDSQQQCLTLQTFREATCCRIMRDDVSSYQRVITSSVGSVQKVVPSVIKIGDPNSNIYYAHSGE